MIRAKLPPIWMICAALALGVVSARADFVDNNLHSNVTIASAVSIVEADAVQFGNFIVGGTIGGGDADIVLAPDSTRVSHNGAATTITLASGGLGNGPYSAAGAGIYHISGAGSGSYIYVQFVQSLGVPIDSSNPVTLTGPAGSDDFLVDSFTFNETGSDGSGDYIAADGTGDATLHVGATLHTKAGATSYAEGVYRGTFGIVASY